MEVDEIVEDFRKLEEFELMTFVVRRPLKLSQVMSFVTQLEKIYEDLIMGRYAVFSILLTYQEYTYKITVDVPGQAIETREATQQELEELVDILNL